MIDQFSTSPLRNLPDDRGRLRDFVKMCLFRTSPPPAPPLARPAGAATMPSARRFPPPWSVEDQS